MGYSAFQFYKWRGVWGRVRLHQEAVPFHRIVEALTRLNEMYDEDEDSIPKERTRKKFPAIYKKCSAHKFWLFAEVGRLVVEDLKRLL